jgi:phage/plasmid-like protein (TIGR03299 family)
MAHELDFTKGRAAIAYASEDGWTPWHKYGTPFKKAFTSEEALKAAGLDYEVELQELSTPSVVCESHKAVVRTDSQAVLGVVGNNYEPLQNKDAFRFFDALVKGKEARYETAGALKGGRQIWLLAKIEGQIDILKNDPINKYFLLTNRHDGLGCVAGRVSGIRVCCNNTLSAAMGRKVKEEIRLVHRGNVADRLEFAGELLAKIGAYYNELTEVYRKFAKVQMKEKQMRVYIAEALRPYGGVKTEQEALELAKLQEEEGISVRLQTEVNNVLTLVENGLGTDIKGVRGTLWGTYNAITEYIDHHKTPRSGDEGRIQYIGFGTGKMVKDAAFRIGMRFAKTGFVEKNTVLLN